MTGSYIFDNIEAYSLPMLLICFSKSNLVNLLLSFFFQINKKMTRSYNTDNSPSRASLLLNTSNDLLLDQEPPSNMQTCIPQVQTCKQTNKQTRKKLRTKNMPSIGTNMQTNKLTKPKKNMPTCIPQVQIYKQTS